MLENQNFTQPAPGRLQWPATIGLLVINVAAFLLQVTVLPHALVENYLTLSLDGLRHGFVWQLLTYQFLHGGLLHLLLNCWALYVFGRYVELFLGRTRFLVLYFVSGIAGGLLQSLAALIWPYYFDNGVVGASAGIFGVVTAFAMLFPEQRLKLLLFFVIPVNMRAKFLLVINVVFAALGIAFPRSLFGGNIAHAAHLGGILAGLAFIRLRKDVPPISWRSK